MSFFKSFKFNVFVACQFFFAFLSYSQNSELNISLYFSKNKIALTETSQISLSRFVANCKSVKGIMILGRCDRFGDNALNDNLSFNRAITVRDYLISNGFPSENISLVAGLGKRSPIEPNSTFTDSLNRVVSITVPQNSLPIKSTSKEVKSVSSSDSIVFIIPPYDLKYLAVIQSPAKGDTLLIDTNLNQIDDILFIKRTLYIAEGLMPSRPKQLTSYIIHDSTIMVHPPYASQYLTLYRVPHNGDTLLIDTSFNQVNSTLFINRNLYIANDTAHLNYSLTPKEIPEKTKAKVLIKALLDTMEDSSPGDAFIIRGLDFEFGYHVMPTSDLPALQAIDTALKKWPYLKLEIQGHLCCGEKGKESYDKQTSQYDLSNNRAKEVYDYLITQRVDKTRISYKGYGMEYPLADPEGDKKDQYRNRRIQFLILDK